MKVLGVSIALLLAAGCTLQPVTSANSHSVVSTSGSVRYDCSSYFDDKTILTLPVPSPNRGTNTVTVTFDGGPLTATYARDGLSQLWIFQDRLYVKLRPDLRAAYMDFRGAKEGEKRTPTDVFECKKRGR